MLQYVADKLVYVVDLKEIPTRHVLSQHPSYFQALRLYNMTAPNVEAPYAEAFNAALDAGLFTEPGKYGISVDSTTGRWDVYRIIEGN